MISMKNNHITYEKKKEILKEYNLPFSDTDKFVEFIMEHFDTFDFEDSFIDMGGCGESNEIIKYSVEDKKEAIRECLLELLSI